MLIRALPCAQQQSGMQVGCLGTSTRWVSAITHSLSIWLALADHSTCAYTHMHTYITHARMPVFMHIHTHARTQTHKPATHTLKCMLIPACTYVRVHAHKHTHTHTCTHSQTHICTHSQTHIHMHTHKHTHLHARMYTHKTHTQKHTQLYKATQEHAASRRNCRPFHHVSPPKNGEAPHATNNTVGDAVV
jgi:hypothetical protein